MSRQGGRWSPARTANVIQRISDPTAKTSVTCHQVQVAGGGGQAKEV